jgi:hypothetical protein
VHLPGGTDEGEDAAHPGGRASASAGA